MKRLKLPAVVLMLVAMAWTGLRADVMIGIPGSSATQDCIPFGCGHQAQFIYDSSFFSGPITIMGLQFFNSVDDSDRFDPATYTIKLSTTSSAVGNPSSVFADNLGSDAQTFTTVAVSDSTIPSTFTYTGTPFTYNPANGNLLIEFDKPDSSETFNGYADYNSGLAAARVWSSDNGGSGSIDLRYAPVVNILTADSPPITAPVPEPSSLVLAGAGLITAAGYGLRRRLSRNA